MFLIRNRRFRVTILLLMGTLAIVGELIYLRDKLSAEESFTPVPTITAPEAADYNLLTEPNYSTSVVATGLSNPWDLSFITDDIFLYSQRGGEIRGHSLSAGSDWLIAKPEDVYARGEGGLLGLLADVDFASNRFIYTCMNVQTGPSITVSKWTLAADNQSFTDRQDIVTQIPSNPSGRHSGCRLAMGSEGHLWVGTGDTAVGTLPQDPMSLGGKVLRVDRDGNAVAGNLPAPFDPRIFNSGHRNVQGITLFPEPIDGVYGFTSEHGTGEDDEVNLLKQGNFGWDPQPGYYNENTPMTDLNKFPDAISASWRSGSATIAVSGMTIVQGDEWGAWKGTILLAVQKNQHVRLLRFDRNYQLIQERVLFEGYGRIRTVVQAPDRSLYLLTDNGGGRDQIIQVVAAK